MSQEALDKARDLRDLVIGVLSAAILYLSLFVLVGCGGAGGDSSASGLGANDQEEIRIKIEALSLITTQLDTLVRSDFSTCPSNGDTSDPLIRKMCQVAQASTIEAQIQLQNELANAVSAINGELDAINSDLVSHQANFTLINAQLTTLLSDVAGLDSRLSDAEDAIQALQDLTSSITGTLNGTMQAVTIGEENLSAGPVYEILLRRSDKTRINGYVNAYGTSLSVSNNGVDPTNGSSTVTVSTTSNHGLVAGDLVQLLDLTEGSGFSSGDLFGEFTVTAVGSVTTFDITMPRNATSGTAFGGTVGVVRKVIGRGMASIWKTGDASDNAVRVTSAGSKSYNFVIRRLSSDVAKAEVCYDSTNRSATFATINAAAEGGSGNVVCK